MRLSMEQYLRLAVPFTPPELFSPQALEPILALSRRLPACSSSGFEVRLGEEAPVADFLVNLLPTDGTRTAFAGRHPDAPLDEEFLGSEVWQRVRDFCQSWESPGSALHSQVRDMWLEFDLKELGAGVPIPGVFFGANTESGELLGTVERSLALLRTPGHGRLPPGLLRCVELLPKPPRIEQLGMMFSRQSDELRLCIRGLSPHGMGEFLARAGWGGRPEELQAVIEDARPFVDEFTLDIDVGEGVLPKIGLECILDRDTHPDRWRRWLDHLVARHLCTPRKRDGVLAWIGLSTQRTQAELWPENLVRASQRTPGLLSGFQRRVNHLKLVHQPGQPLQVKAYLAFRHMWVRPSSSARSA
ncbi:MAG: hypothetical protein ACJ8AT_29945 [Hyalangium sp.]|uniref:hypothetical protein n=1 Tax=Hyalangium sp. TaxID=2028555 RepID=UPI00389981BE